MVESIKFAIANCWNKLQLNIMPEILVSGYLEAILACFTTYVVDLAIAKEWISFITFSFSFMIHCTFCSQGSSRAWCGFLCFSFLFLSFWHILGVLMFLSDLVAHYDVKLKSNFVVNDKFLFHFLASLFGIFFCLDVFENFDVVVIEY